MSSSNYFRSWIDRPHLDPNTRLLTEEYQRGITEFMGLVHRQPEAKTVTKFGIIMGKLIMNMVVLANLSQRVETGQPKRTDEPRAEHGRTRAGCRWMRAERDGTRLLPIGFASCFLSGLQAADRDSELVDREHELAVMRTEDEVT
ncbi:hypothetical protein F2Q68_00016966 [Brassica cretica]|uniref:Uncharacterized protein n=1 Tax=Brassica cretica TaxID=69181 RepID=A0A8S9HT08_BRACR|nr:hypothetical protein F2Q68_00016966 [Brassica cretica]